MSYILIYWLVANASGPAPTGSVTFSDQAACNATLKAIERTWTGELPGVPGVCVAQATPPTDPDADPAPVVVTPGPPSAPVIAKAPKAHP